MSHQGMNSDLQKLRETIHDLSLQKAEEIRIRAIEDYEIKKAKQNQEIEDELEVSYKKSLGTIYAETKVALSQHKSANARQVLQKRKEVIEKVFTLLRARVKAIPEQDYRRLLESVILEGLDELATQSSITIRVRPKDVSLAEQIRDDEKTQEKIQSIGGPEVKVEGAKDKSLSDASLGGAVLVALGGKIVCDNSLETRLEILASDSAPQVRELLFGVNEKRRFKD